MLIRELQAAAHNISVLVAEVASDLLETEEDEASPGAASGGGGGGAEAGAESSTAADGYDHIMADVWVGAVLTLLIFSCICCVCSCLLYHKFRQWKNRAVAARGLAEASHGRGPLATVADASVGVGLRPDSESLPSYTIVSGLPSYDEALEQLRQAREGRRASNNNSNTITNSNTQQFTKLSVADLFPAQKSYQLT